MSISKIISIHWTVIRSRTKITDIKIKKVEVYKLVVGFPFCLKKQTERGEEITFPNFNISVVR